MEKKGGRTENLGRRTETKREGQTKKKREGRERETEDKRKEGGREKENSDREG